MSLPRRLSAAVLAVALLPVLAGCGVGENAATLQQSPSGDGATVDTGPLAARGLLLVAGEVPSRASLVGSVINTGAVLDAITGVSVTGGTGTPTVTLVDGSVPGGSIRLPGTSSTQFGYGPETRVDVTGLDVLPGRFATVSIRYRTAGTATTLVLVVPATGMYQDLGPLPLAAAPAG